MARHRASQPSLQEGEIALESNEFQVTGKTVTLIGRHHVAADKGAFGFSNSAAGVAFAFEGTELAVYLSASAYKEGYFHYVTIIIDDREPIALPIRQAGWQEVATDLEAGKRHTVRILKRSEPTPGTSASIASASPKGRSCLKRPRRPPIGRFRCWGIPSPAVTATCGRARSRKTSPNGRMGPTPTPPWWRSGSARRWICGHQRYRSREREK